MGVGFDMFKAVIGYSIAEGVVNSVSDAMERSSAESAVREQNAKDASFKNNMLRILVFMLGNNIELDRDGKKQISSYLSEVTGEKISLFVS